MIATGRSVTAMPARRVRSGWPVADKVPELAAHERLRGNVMSPPNMTVRNDLEKYEGVCQASSRFDRQGTGS